MKKNKSRGSVLIVFIFAALAAGLLLGGLVRWGGVVLQRRRQAIALQSVLLTVLRTQADSLERLAIQGRGLETWARGADGTGLTVLSSDLESVQRAASDLRSSLSGYKGRITAVRKVAADANRLDAEAVEVRLQLNPPIGVTPQGQWIVDETGHRTWVDSLWLQRSWGATFPPAYATYHLSHSSGRVVWEARPGRAGANGGFPQSWNEAQQDGGFHPYRQSYFSARSGLP